MKNTINSAHRRRLAGRWILHTLFALYMLVLLKFTIFREPLCLDNFMKSGTLNLRFFTAYLPFVNRHMWWRITYLFGGNIVCFVPFGAYLRWRGFKIMPTVLLGFCLSFFIEAMQYVWGVGVSELDDLILNTLGVLLGAVIVRKRRAQADAADEKRGIL